MVTKLYIDSQLSRAQALLQGEAFGDEDLAREIISKLITDLRNQK